MAMNSFNYDPQNTITDVTAVKFIGKWIIAGIGGSIYVYETESGKFVTKKYIFEGQRIHHIIVGNDQKIALAGGQLVQLFKIENSDSFMISKSTAWNLHDWIHYLHWFECGNIAIATAHNEISLWNSETGEKLKSATCEVTCILYCALIIGSSWDELIMFAGTMFKHILIWSPSIVKSDEATCCPLLHSVIGHDGVIFSVSYDSSCQLICSTSDDRSVRLWSVDMEFTDSCNHVELWKNAKIVLLHTMYNHRSRVWRNIILHNTIISVGEDSRLCMWNRDGSVQRSWRTHQNGSVWCIDYNKKKNLLVTGGADGGVSLWPAYTVRPKPISLELSEDLFVKNDTSVNGINRNIPRRIGLTDKGNIVAVTDSGHILYCEVLSDSEREWKLVHHDDKLASYCLLEMSPCKQYVALANLNGCILIFKEESTAQSNDLILNIEEDAVNGRIFSLLWLSSEIILICGPEGLLEMWKISIPHKLEKMNEFELPKSKERWISAASLKENVLVCGDRCGSIHLFKIDDCQKNTLQSPSQSVCKIHGRLGVSSLVWHGNYLYSTGRDGTLRRYCLSESHNRLDCLNADKLQVEWPATTSLSVFGLLVLGFKAVNFSLWSHEERRTLFTMPCGGGHRSWDWTLKENAFTFVFLKDKMIHFYTCLLDHIVKPVLQRGFHSKHINCIIKVPLLKREESWTYQLLVSGSEDTTVRLSVVNSSNVIQSQTVLQSHISSVRALTCCPLGENVLVFSAGGRAQLKVWKFAIQEVSVSGGIPQVICQELCSHMLRDPSTRNKKPWVSMVLSPDSDIRYMDLSCVILQNQTAAPEHIPTQNDIVLLAAGCSDGLLRIFGFNTFLNELKLIGKFFFHGRCILKVSLIEFEDLGHIVLTMATDGKVAFWDLRMCVEKLKNPIQKPEASTSKNDVPIIADKLVPFSFVKIHQSGINSFDWLKLTDDMFLLATGGDDNALVLNVICISQIQGKMQAEVFLQWRNDFAHLSQITGLKFEGNLLLSAAIDQRIKIWNWNCELENKTLSVTFEAEYCSTIADIHGMLAWTSSSSIIVCVHGNGMEIVNVQQR